MPATVKVWDKVDRKHINMFAVDANEAIQRDPKRYSFETPPVVPGREVVVDVDAEGHGHEVDMTVHEPQRPVKAPVEAADSPPLGTVRVAPSPSLPQQQRPGQPNTRK